MRIRTPLRLILAVALILAAVSKTLAGQEAESPTPNASAIEDQIGTGTDDTRHFLNLSLEELMETEVKQISVLGTHTHLSNEWMIGYQFMPMLMSGIRDGTTRRSPADVLQDFMVTPTRMRMEMHMVNVMYAPSDRLTLMTMVPFTKVEMDHRTRMGMTFTTAAAGLGDLNFSGLYSAVGDARRDRHRLLIRAGVTVPTGSINERGNTPAGADQRLPYPMQLGSGTYDLYPGLSYLGESHRWAWTAETLGTVRLGTNANAYRLGNRWRVGASVHRRLTRQVGPFVRLEAERWGNIIGADPDLNAMMVPTANPALQSGNRAVVAVGLEFYVADRAFKQNRFAIEFGFPVHQSLGGPQLETAWSVHSGWNVTF